MHAKGFSARSPRAIVPHCVQPRQLLYKYGFQSKDEKYLVIKEGSPFPAVKVTGFAPARAKAFEFAIDTSQN